MSTKIPASPAAARKSYTATLTARDRTPVEQRRPQSAGRTPTRSAATPGTPASFMQPTVSSAARASDPASLADRALMEELENIAMEKEKLQRSLRKAVQMLNEERERTRKMQITVDVVQQELVDTVSELRRERDARQQAEQRLARADIVSGAVSASVSSSSVPSVAAAAASSAAAGRAAPCATCGIRQQLLDAAASGGDISAQLVAELVQQRVALERALVVAAFGEQVPPDAAQFIQALLSSRTLVDGTPAEVHQLLQSLVGIAKQHTQEQQAREQGQSPSDAFTSRLPQVPPPPPPATAAPPLESMLQALGHSKGLPFGSGAASPAVSFSVSSVATSATAAPADRDAIVSQRLQRVREARLRVLDRREQSMSE